MTKQTVYPRPPLLEQLGALCSLMAHDLANQLCVISGSASFGQLAPDDPKRMATALETIARASEVAGHAVSSFGEYRRTLPTAFVPGPAWDIVDALVEYARSSGWKHVRMSSIHGSILLPPHWAVFAAQGIKTELHSRPVLLKMSMHERSVSGCHGPASGEADRGSNCKQGLQILFKYESNDALSIKEVRSRYENLELLAVFELNRMLGGILESRTICRGNQEIELWLPLEHES